MAAIFGATHAVFGFSYFKGRLFNCCSLASSMNCRQLYLPIACVLVFIVAGISGKLQQTPSTAPAIPYYILKNANIANISSTYILTKLVVKISAGDIKDQSYAVCVGYHYGNASGDFVGIKQYQYYKFDGTVTENDLSPFVLTFLDMNMIDKGDSACSIAIMEDIGPLMRLGPPFSSYQVDHKPIVTALSKPDYAAVNTALFYCNKTSCFDGDYNTFSETLDSQQYNSINVAHTGLGTFVTAMSFDPSAGAKQGQIGVFNGGGWTITLTDSPARDVSVTSWDDSDYMFCYDNGALTVADAPAIYCRARDGTSDIVVDKGIPKDSNATFSQVQVSPLNDKYALVTAVATNDLGSRAKLYAITRGADGTVDTRTIYVAPRAQKVASHSFNNISAALLYDNGKLDLYILGFNASVLPPDPTPVASPIDVPISQPPVPAPISAPIEDSRPIASTVTEPVAAPQLTDGEKAGIGVGVSGFAAGVGLLVLLLMLKKKRDEKKKQGDEVAMGALGKSNNSRYGQLGASDGKYSNISAVGVDEDDGIAVPTSIQPSEIDKGMHIPYKSLVFVKEIGSGSYGKVYLGEWRGAKVAIKVNNTVTDVDGFLAEAKLTLGITPHPNLVQTFGVSLDGPNPCIVLEYCGGGSLDQLFDVDEGLTNEKKLDYALKIGYGLLHLHSRNIVHRDMAARNILLTNDGQPKISDFGMSRIVQEEAAKGKTKTMVGPLRWMAPECLKEQTYSLKSDVWGFGITVYEIVAGKEPHADEDQLEIALKIRNEGETPKIPEDCDPVLRECMEMCWKFSPNDRPTMEEICAFIRAKTTGASGEYTVLPSD